MQRSQHRQLQRHILSAFAIALGWCAASLEAQTSPPVDFVKDIRPIFERSCYSCHGPQKQRANLRLDMAAAAFRGGDTGPAFVPGQSGKSLLIDRITTTDADSVMPKKGDRLAAEQVDLLKTWIDQGAHWPENADIAAASPADHWSFKPIKRVDPPAVANGNWPRNDVDRFILARLEAEKLEPQREADRETLIRRLSFDLTGLPPTPEEITAFAAENAFDAYERLVDRLLASPRYGECWARHWLDIVRFAETHGFEMNQPRPNAWPYRDWVIKAFNDDMSYDQFVREQLVGDAGGADAATGYLVAGPMDQVKSPDVTLTRQQRADELHDMVSNASSTFLGLTAGCARCHDHKFDPIPQTDYYRLTAIFAGVHHGERDSKVEDSSERDARRAVLREQIARLDKQVDQAEPVAEVPQVATGSLRPLVAIRRNVDRFAPITAKFVRFTISETNNGSAPCIDELEVWTTGRETYNAASAHNGGKATVSGTIKGYAIHQSDHLIDGLYGNSHSWISDESGRGWVQIELPKAMLIDRVIWGRDREERFTDRLPIAYRVEVGESPGDWKTVATSDDREPFRPGREKTIASEKSPSKAERARLERELASLSNPRLYAGSFTQPAETFRLQRGDPMQPREAVTPGVIAFLKPTAEIKPDATDRDRRSALARWITDPANPLPSRVIVNRLWHYHFGRGIVSTPSDFGHMGAKPSHPELLDYLASELVARHWSIKAIQRLIVCSAAYRQASAPDEHGIAADADDALLWRYPPRRLEAEAIHDAVLAVSGKLDLTMGGPGYDVFKPDSSYVRVWIPKEDFGPAEWRRMVYQFKPRSQPEPTFGVFDCPDGGQAAPRRSSSTTPLQALNLLNSRFVLQQAGFFADRLAAEYGNDRRRQIERAFLLAFGRPPTEVEVQASVEFIDREGLPAFCRALFNANEFVQVF